MVGPEHLFHFAEYVEGFRGWGRGLREAIGAWYNGMPADSPAYQAVKYGQPRIHCPRYGNLPCGYPPYRGNHPSHNSAKKALEFTVAIPRAELRPRYGDGFAGAPIEQRCITRAAHTHQ